MTEVSRLNQTKTGSISGLSSDTSRIAFVEQIIWQAHRARLDGGRYSSTPPKPSALRVAVLRAAHQLLDDPLVFEDPFALSILGEEGEAVLRSDPSLCQAPPPNAFRASLVLRSRFTEDQWAEARRSGARQYVILGAGLDTFAYRNTNYGSRVFEVDLPAMIRWKRGCLQMAGIGEPDSLAFVTTDFEHVSPAKPLKRAGFDLNVPAFFSWLGVTMYLDEEAVLNTLRFVASLPSGSGIVFDYAVRPDLLPPREQQVMNRIDKRMADGGEPWKTHLDPTTFPNLLLTLGFSEVDDLGPEELNECYLSGRTDGMRKTGLTRIVHARV